MPLTPRAILSDVNIRSALQQAWTDSNPGVTGGHEEGGFVVKNADANLSAIRWLNGLQDTIKVPLHPDCKIDDLEIVASFHTHTQTQAVTICKNQVKPTNALSAMTLI